MTITASVRRLALVIAAAVAFGAALLAAAWSPPKAEACVLTPLSPCGIVGSKVWPIYYEVEPTVERVLWQAQNCSVNGTVTGECQPG